MSYIRSKTRPQGDRPIIHEQKNFGQGLNVDIPASDFDSNANQNLENYIAFERYPDGRSGTVHIHDLPGSGTIHSIAIHPTSKICIMHRGTKIWEVKTVDAEILSFLSDTATISPASFGIDKKSTLKPFGENFMISTVDGIFQILIEYTNKSFFQTNSGQPLDTHDIGVDQEQAPYKIKTVYTFSIIVDEATGLAPPIFPGQVDRLTPGYKLVWESPPVLSGESSIDNASFYRLRTATLELGKGAGHTSLTTALGAKDLAATLEQKITHISAYQTADLGINGKNNLSLEQFAFSAESIVDHNFLLGNTVNIALSDTQVDSRTTASSLTLKNPDFIPLPSGDLFEVTPGFLFSATSQKKVLSYSQRVPDDSISGFHNPALQFHEFDDGITVIAGTPDFLSTMTNRTSNYATLTAHNNFSINESIIVLSHFANTDDTFGVTDPKSFVKMEEGSYISICSDKSVRVWDGNGWSRDVAEDRVRSIIERIEEGTTIGGYYRGAYFIWFKVDDAVSGNNVCMRFSATRESGKGWTFYTGDDWSFPGNEAGVFKGGNFLDTAQPDLEFFFIVDASDDKIYWMETFDGPDGLSINSFQIGKYWADKVSSISPNGTDIICKIRTRDVTGSRESFNLKHSESHAYLRDLVGALPSTSIPTPPDTGIVYPELLVDAIAFVDGVQVPTETTGRVKTDGDIQFWRRVEGSRIAIEFQTSRSGHRLVGIDSRFRVQDIQRPNRGPSTTVAADFQSEMLANLQEHHFSRPRLFVDRTRQTVMPNGKIATQIGPDGRNDAIQIGVNDAPFERFKFANSTVYTDEFTIMFMVGDVSFSGSADTVIAKFQDSAGVDNFTLVAEDATTMSIVEGSGTVTVDSVMDSGPINGYHHMVLVRTTGDDVRLYQNNELKGTLTFSGAFGGGFFQVGAVA
tara:strand:- start:17069 stop:19813 length:2745 start_codon:yes stop_codon:yes gene_type:complete